jgi:hypothetical protein
LNSRPQRPGPSLGGAAATSPPQRPAAPRGGYAGGYGAEDYYGSGDDYDDDELDGFIDDGPEGGEADWRKEIRKMTGYDPSRYADDWGDDRRMEASWEQLQAEERRSARMGRLEDQAAEEEEARRLKAKAVRKRRRGAFESDGDESD